ncbi:MAG: ABC transporter ATP-binding protein [Anaerolineales bacterium]|nr:ABC transporter ATP-binding protein [Anaerolineales bacterium]
MSDSVISFENVSKRFRLLKIPRRAFQDVFVNMFNKEVRGRHHFWALQDVTFSIKAGETVGILGANGSGKSTILKLISRIIDPTTGVIRVAGRLSALLELGAGFHPDLTGRENIYLNGSILGLNRQAMDSKFDSIVDFAGIDEFIDAPVRSYSSGMQMRLGFSVAIHVEPEIILVDEVLAVGDYSFQLKCLERIRLLQKLGVTILFVSHDFEAVESLCTRAIWLEHGRLQAQGEVTEILTEMRTRYHWNSKQNITSVKEAISELDELMV